MATALKPRNNSSLRRLPPVVALAVRKAMSSPRLNEGVRELLERQKTTLAFPDEDTAILAGLAMIPDAKAMVDRALDQVYTKADAGSEPHEEAIIGGGLHAAIYCAARAKMGFRRPLVIEANDTLGGIFHMSASPSFYLNSRNRPGPLGLPGRPGSLNALPGSILQPADLSASEYQRNSDLAYVIRLALAMYSRAVVRHQVIEISPAESPVCPGGFRLACQNKAVIYAKRVIDARGLGVPKSTAVDARILNYPEFMKRMDDHFPFAGMRRVAVIGAGDSGRTVVEALTGQGPSQHWGVASLDWVEQIDWYGGDDMPRKGERWLECNRSRYAGIARFMPKRLDAKARIQPVATRGVYSPGFGCAYVNDRPYDYVIVCTGLYTNNGLYGEEALKDAEVKIGERVVATRVVATEKPQRELYRIGPRAAIPLSNYEANDELIKQIPENATALFRLAERTAMLASMLSGRKR